VIKTIGVGINVAVMTENHTQHQNRKAHSEY
jgi:hypothetical protein